MLKAFHALPTEGRVREMKNRDYLWCLTNMLLDREEELERLCPGCRLRALEEPCAAAPPGSGARARTAPPLIWSALRR